MTEFQSNDEDTVLARNCFSFIEGHYEKFFEGAIEGFQNLHGRIGYDLSIERVFQSFTDAKNIIEGREPSVKATGAELAGIVVQRMTVCIHALENLLRLDVPAALKTEVRVFLNALREFKVVGLGDRYVQDLDLDCDPQIFQQAVMDTRKLLGLPENIA